MRRWCGVGQALFPEVDKHVKPNLGLPDAFTGHVSADVRGALRKVVIRVACALWVLRITFLGVILRPWLQTDCTWVNSDHVGMNFNWGPFGGHHFGGFMSITFEVPPLSKFTATLKWLIGSGRTSRAVHRPVHLVADSLRGILVACSWLLSS